MSEPTLEESLEAAGYRSERGIVLTTKRFIIHKHTNKSVGEFSAREAWDWLRTHAAEHGNGKGGGSDGD